MARSAAFGGLVATAGSDLSSEWPLLVGPLAVLAVAAVALFRRGAAGPGGERWERQLARIPNALEAITGIPGWAAAVVGMGLFAATLSVVGFYTDVAWHIQFGRDKTLWTPPHAMIVTGLVLISLSAALGVVLATITGARVGFRWGRWRVPWSMLPLAAFGTAATVGFPLDDLWHAAYGVDVTLWSPTHLLMVSAGGLSTISLWMTLREARVHPGDGFWPLAVYWVLAGATLVRLSTFQAEFDLGVPQFQQLFHPVIVTLAAAAGLVAIRILLGRGGALIMAGGFLVLRAALGLLVGPGLGYLVPRFPLYLASALAVEAAAAWFGTERRGRFALAAGVGVATAGLAGEWWWTQVWARHPWDAALLPEAVLVTVPAAIGGAVIGAATGAAAGGQPTRFRAAVIGLAGLAVLASLAVPSPRTGADITGDLALERRGDEAVVSVALDPPGAAEGANWFEVVSWQGGGLVNTPMLATGEEGRYRSERAVPVTGNWKTIVRLHRGTVLVGLPVYLPADAEIGAPLIPAEDGPRRFVLDSELMLREAKPGPATVRVLAYTVIVVAAVASIGLLVLATRRLRGGHAGKARQPVSGHALPTR